MRVQIDLRRVLDWDSFHDVFAQELGFFDGYGRNMDAWIDCMTYVDEDEGTSSLAIAPDDVLVLELEGVRELRDRAPEIYEGLIDCAAFVNWRRLETGARAALLLSYR